MVARTIIRPIPEDDVSSFIIHDNSSEIAKIIPEKYIEPLVIIARIKGFDGVDDYIIHLIKDRLEMFADTHDDYTNQAIVIFLSIEDLAKMFESLEEYFIKSQIASYFFES